ncbi:MAG: hypothetical protein JWP76_951 [Dactylosporangium sp.]|nr:hypothetical protein [Dactylosporangium sp.]
MVGGAVVAPGNGPPATGITASDVATMTAQNNPRSSMCYLRTSSPTVCSSVTPSLPKRTRSAGSVSLPTTGRGVQGHLRLGFGDVRAGRRRFPVGVGDRLAFHVYLFALHRDGDLLLLGGDGLAQPGPAGLHLLGARPQPLLGARHRVVAALPVP